MRSLLLLSLLPLTAVALDLSPRETVRDLEGVQIPTLSFTDGKHSVKWDPPAKWRMSFDRGVLTLTSPDSLRAQMTLRMAAKEAGDVTALSKSDTIPKFCAAFLPKLATKITYRSTTAGVFTIGPNPAREYVLDVEEPTGTSQASVCLVEYSKDERFVVTIIAPPKQFEEARDAVVQSLFSWQID